MKFFEMLDVNLIHLFYAFLGVLMHFLKTWLAAVRRKEVFFKQETQIYYILNCITAFAVTAIGADMPPDVYVPSPASALLVGISAPSILSGFMRYKAPGENVSEETDILKITKDSRTTNQQP
jgi:hypothetical protein